MNKYQKQLEQENKPKEVFTDAQLMVDDMRQYKRFSHSVLLPSTKPSCAAAGQCGIYEKVEVDRQWKIPQITLSNITKSGLIPYLQLINPFESCTKYIICKDESIYFIKLKDCNEIIPILALNP